MRETKAKQDTVAAVEVSTPEPVTPTPSTPAPAAAIAEANAVVSQYAPAPQLDAERPRDRMRLRDYLGGRPLAELTEPEMRDAATRFRSMAFVNGAVYEADALRVQLEYLIAGLDAPTP